MSFLNPWLLTGLAAVAVPLLIHLIRREDRSGQPFPSLMFLRKVPVQVRSHRKLRDPLLLLFRCLLLVLLALAFAAPIVNWTGSAAGEDPVEHDWVFALDRSYSMAAGDRWPRIVDIVTQRIDALPGDERAALITFDDTVTVVSELSNNTDQLRASLATLSPGTRGTDYAGPLVSGAELLNQGGAQQRSLVLFTDLQRNAVQRSDGLSLSDDINFEIETVDAPIAGNVGIVQASVVTPHSGTDNGIAQPGPTSGGDTDGERNQNNRRLLQVQLTNNGEGAVEDHPVTVRIGGRPVYNESLDIDAGAEARVTVPFVLATRAVTQIGIESGDDDLATDNRFNLVATPGRTIHVVALVDSRRDEDDALFVDTALSVATTPGYTFQTLSIGNAQREAFEDVDVVMIDATHLAVPTLAERLNAFVDNGGGLLVIAADATDNTTENENANANPTGVFAAFGEPLEPGGGTLIDAVQRDHPLATAWLAGNGRALGTARITRFQRIEPAEQDNVIATLDNGAPLLIERQLANGRVLYLSTRFARHWSSLALQPGFVRALQSTVDYLGQRQSAAAAFSVGQTVDLDHYAGGMPSGQSGAGAGGAIIELPNGLEHRLRAGQQLYTTTMPGMHTLHSTAAGSRELPFAVNVTSSEIDLEQTSAEALTDRVSRHPPAVLSDAAAISRAGAEDQAPPIAWYLLLAAAILIILETAYANRLSTSRAH